MKIRIYGEYPDGIIDSWLIEGDTIDELRETARAIVESRQLANYWSEEIDND